MLNFDEYLNCCFYKSAKFKFKQYCYFRALNKNSTFEEMF